MAAAELDLYIEQGAKFYRTLTLKSANVPIDITGYSFRGQIRKSQSDSTILASFSFNILNQVSFTGQVEMTMSDAVTSSLPVPTATSFVRKTIKYIYDVEVVNSSGVVDRMLQGSAEVSPEVTR